jgi:hypothetical protein
LILPAFASGHKETLNILPDLRAAAWLLNEHLDEQGVLVSEEISPCLTRTLRTQI